ncbi:hypothetical protein K435DRAFT_598884, partial [Dendrothele bispora CBS 962.96]
EWVIEFETDIKKCGEAFQRHVCKDVCDKYKKDGVCRFQFPHEIIQESYFDPDTNSVYMQCLEEDINYHNPVILACTRNNHDLKCILSGKAAKAAMFYITDYITKTDMKTHEMLSLL